MKECPVCHLPLRELPKYGVVIDLCPSCRGAWLDGGELEKIISLAQEFRDEYERMAERRYIDGRDRRDVRFDDDYYKRPHGDHHDKYDDHYYKKKRKRGIMDIFGELFD